MVSWHGMLGDRCNKFNLLALPVRFYGRDKLVSGRRAPGYVRGHYIYVRGEVVSWRGKLQDRRDKFNKSAWQVGLWARQIN